MDQQSPTPAAEDLGKVKAQLKAWLELLRALTEVIRDSGAIGAPSSVLYTACMQQGISLEVYTKAIEAIKRTGLVQEKHHCLYWVEPKEGSK
jgi:hypothetical protein